MVIGELRWHLDKTEVARAVKLLEDGEAVSVVAYVFDVSPSEDRQLWRHYYSQALFSL